MSTFIDTAGNRHRVDRGFNHFVNGKCVNPKSWEETPIGKSFEDLEEIVPQELQITGHVPEFTYGLETEFTDLKHVITGHKAW